MEQTLRQRAEEERARAALQLGSVQQQYDGTLHEVQSLMERLAAQDAKASPQSTPALSSKHGSM